MDTIKLKVWKRIRSGAASSAFKKVTIVPWNSVISIINKMNFQDMLQIQKNEIKRYYDKRT